MSPVIILRPEPGASRTAESASRLGLDIRLHPLFEAKALTWSPPSGSFDALLLTSAQAARLAGRQLAHYHACPAYAVGPATSGALAGQGFKNILTGDRNAQAIIHRIAADGHRTLLHLCGADVAPADPGPLTVRQVPVYAMIEVGDQASLHHLLQPGAILLVHSPRAGQRLAALVDRAARESLHIVAISTPAQSAAGDGWASSHAAPRPTDDDLLALAARLCK